LVSEYANEHILDQDYLEKRDLGNGVVLRSKEEMLYYQIFTEHFGDVLPPEAVGRTRSVTEDELQ
jgi:asparagine synthase (glutamine-hydrolysing)